VLGDVRHDAEGAAASCVAACGSGVPPAGLYGRSGSDCEGMIEKRGFALARMEFRLTKKKIEFTPR
jgi:hypothetical protein